MQQPTALIAYQDSFKFDSSKSMGPVVANEAQIRLD